MNEYQDNLGNVFESCGLLVRGNQSQSEKNHKKGDHHDYQQGWQKKSVFSVREIVVKGVILIDKRLVKVKMET